MTQSISAIELKEPLKSETPPILFDVRKKPAFDADPRVIHNAKWQSYEEASQWGKHIPQNTQVVVYCVHGHEVSQSTAQTLRNLGSNAIFLEGGIGAWIEADFEVSISH